MQDLYLVCRGADELFQDRTQWELLSAVTDPVYVEMPLAQVHAYKGKGEDSRRFHWKRLLPAVHAELERVQQEVEAPRP